MRKVKRSSERLRSRKEHLLKALAKVPPGEAIPLKLWDALATCLNNDEWAAATGDAIAHPHKQTPLGERRPCASCGRIFQQTTRRVRLCEKCFTRRDYEEDGRMEK